MDLTHLQIAEIPDDGMHIEGSLPPGIFDIDPADGKATTPMDYSLDLFVTGDAVVATGRISTSFERECVRCLGRFNQEITLDPYSADLETEGAATINLTERLREDILLSLPAYPHCDSSSDGRKCPAEGLFADSDSSDEDEPESSPPPGAWDVLEDWKQLPPKD